MFDLYDPKFNLVAGDPIYVRIRAENRYGQPMWSNPNIYAAKVIDKPIRVGQPRNVNMTLNSARLTWNSQPYIIEYEIGEVASNSRTVDRTSYSKIMVS